MTTMHAANASIGTDRQLPARAGFTLIELLVVITIILIVSAVALPTVLPALAHRQVSEAARILQAALAGARDAAIRDNAPSGIRLLPDPAFHRAQPRPRHRSMRNGLAARLQPHRPHRDGTRISARDWSRWYQYRGILPRLNPKAHEHGDHIPDLQPGRNRELLPIGACLMVSKYVSIQQRTCRIRPPRGSGTSGSATRSRSTMAVRGTRSSGRWSNRIRASGNAELFVNVGAPGTSFSAQLAARPNTVVDLRVPVPRQRPG